MPLKTAEAVLQLYCEKYFDFNVRHFHEKLVEEHGIQISYSWVKAARQGPIRVKRTDHVLIGPDRSHANNIIPTAPLT